MRKPADLKQRIQKGQSYSQIARVYEMKEHQVASQARNISLINPSPKNIEKYPDMRRSGKAMVSIDRNDISEKELIRGYVAPTGKDLVGEELEIYNEK